jgi:hypothetical protein
MKSSDIIAVKYSEDTAQFAELRPVRRQPMTLQELVGLVLVTTGKQPARLRERLQKGTCTYNIYRYWWDGFALDDATLSAVLAEFPDPDPSRLFHAPECVWMRLYDAQEPVPHSALIEKHEAKRRRWFRGQSLWNFLLEFACSRPPAYLDYSYYHRADLYRRELTPADCARLRQASERLASRALKHTLAHGPDWVWLELACPRAGAAHS